MGTAARSGEVPGDFGRLDFRVLGAGSAGCVGANRLSADPRNRVPPHAPEDYLPGAALDSEADPARAAGDISTTIVHPVSTARMGTDPGAVVAPALTVHGMGGLSIADAAVMPAVPSGDTHAPVTMIAEKAAERTLARGRVG